MTINHTFTRDHAPQAARVSFPAAIIASDPSQIFLDPRDNLLDIAIRDRPIALELAPSGMQLALIVLDGDLECPGAARGVVDLEIEDTVV
jgi:hypothetical protein